MVVFRDGSVSSVSTIDHLLLHISLISPPTSPILPHLEDMEVEDDMEGEEDVGVELGDMVIQEGVKNSQVDIIIFIYSIFTSSSWGRW